MPGCNAPVRGSRTLSRTKRNPSQRQFRSTLQPNSENRPAYNAQIVTAAVDTNDLTLTFDRPVMVRGLTGIQTDVGAVELTATRGATPYEVVIGYDASVAAATDVILPNYVGNVRSRDGGYAVSPTFPVGA